MSHPLLREFVQPVPVIAVTETLATVLALLSDRGYEQAIAQYPAPQSACLLQLGGLAAYLLNRAVAASFKTSPVVNLQATLQEFIDADLDLQRLVLLPLRVLPADWELHQTWQHLHTAESQPWAVIEADGHYLGLLDQPRLWKFLATQLSVPAPWDGVAPAATPSGAVFSQASSAPPDPINSSIPPISPIQPYPATLLPAIPVPLLVTLLNQLPLPLMLQTSSGQVLTQNCTWHEQLGSLIYDHPMVTPAAIAFDTSENHSIDELYTHPIENLHTFSESAWQDNASLRDHPTSHSPNKIPTSPSLNQRDVQHLRTATTLPLPTCHLDALLENEICVCSLDDAQERVWKFVKVPIGALPTAESFSSQENDTLWLFLAQDITDQQNITQELAAKNADLTQLNRLKDEFLSCISHELKAPLTAVLGLSSLLKDQAIGSLNERQERYAQLIYQSGRHLMTIVNNILDLAQIETQQLDLITESISIESVCQRAYEQARQRHIPESATELGQALQTCDPSFRLNIQAGLKQIVADDLRLRQMLVNLLTNALKFTPIGGKIGLDVEDWDGWLAFTVWDTGVGIPADQQHLIFQKFQQLENPLTHRFEGTGLGLVLTQQLARLHGGDVTFTSVDGKGSRFTLLLPPDMAHAVNAGHSAESSPAASPIEQRLVLVVESVPRFLEELTTHLDRLGYRVAIARSGTEALEKIRCLQPAAVFLNSSLPLLSGWDVLTLLKASPKTHAIPILVMGTQAEKKRALSSGAREFLSLPVQSEVLRKSLEALLKPIAPPYVPPLKRNPASGILTVLHLQAKEPLDTDPSSEQIHTANTECSASGVPTTSTSSALAVLLHTYPCRVLELDDLEQADLLARVWQPDVILLDGVLSNPLQYLTQLSRHSGLASLPLITLTAENTQAANRIANLTVFPCLASLETASDAEEANPANVLALFQVMQVASGQR